MEPLNFDGIKAVLGLCSYVGQKNIVPGSEENTCFGITQNDIRCKNRLPNSYSRRKRLIHSRSKLCRIASAYEETDKDEDRSSLAEVFFINLENFINLQHCRHHKDWPKELVAEWQEQVNDAYRDQTRSQQTQKQDKNNEDEDEDEDDDSIASTVSSPFSNISFSLLGDTPRHSRTVTPSTTPQTGKVVHVTASAKSTHSAESDTTLAPVMLDGDDDDGPTPPATPTPGERRVYSTSGTGWRSGSGTAPSTGLSFGQKTPQKQQKQQPPKPARSLFQDETREPLAKLTVSPANDPISDAATTTADRSERLEAKYECILENPQPLKKATVPPRYVNMHANCKEDGFLNYEDCYIGTDYLHIVRTMQSGYGHYKRGTGRLYVLRHPYRSGLFKIGFSRQQKIKNRWQATPCSKLAVQGDREPVFVTEDMFPGARKVEALVKASLRHRNMGYCTLCNKRHTEWFWVEQNVILAWVHAWTAYVQSDVFDVEGSPTMAYHGFANRLLRITPERIHKQLRLTAMQSRELEPHPDPDPEERVAVSATTDVGGGSGSGSGRGSDRGGNGTKEAPLQPKPTPMVSAAATSIQRLVRRAATWDSGNRSSSNKWMEKKGKGLTVVIQEVGELDNPDDRDDSRQRHLRQRKKAPQVASQVASRIQLGISGMVKWGARSSKRS
ncbi:DNA-binding protein [Niveomyces insectorum RCEF 264]|uniref:DNA-binding protein n=1 Tax=Niveomyces insectorum RCEF 264 TaxID=1081102 RepID=A0A167P4F7_9HYPO|nr:DNA-binding protein [Niveomyces insectorum RCEF 264]